VVLPILSNAVINSFSTEVQAIFLIVYEGFGPVWYGSWKQLATSLTPISTVLLKKDRLSMH